MTQNSIVTQGVAEHDVPLIGQKNTNEAAIRRVMCALFVLLFLGFLGVTWTGIRSDKSGSLGAAWLWAFACLAGGAMAGFLFSIPRAGLGSIAPTSLQGGATAQTQTYAKPNTNLEEISDWLTKIIVGLTLVNLKSIGTHVHSVSVNAAASLNQQPEAQSISIATAIISGFAVMGFLLGYLYTRLYLQGAIIRSDREMQGNFNKEISAALKKADQESIVDLQEGAPSSPSKEDREVAKKLARAAPTDHPELVLPQIRELVAQYEDARQTMPYGSARTRKMSSIAARMRVIGYMAQPYLPEFTQSASPGERLVAITSLQMKFNPLYIEWLADRLWNEPAFPAYQAASALLERMKLVGQSEGERIRTAARKAIEKARELNLPAESSRDKLFQSILDFGASKKEEEETK